MYLNEFIDIREGLLGKRIDPSGGTKVSFLKVVG